jgi:predicted regulator of Ras-like GTPase activity (Roadblock/LC7/MglB family)
VPQAPDVIQEAKVDESPLGDAEVQTREESNVRVDVAPAVAQEASPATQEPPTFEATSEVAPEVIADTAPAITAAAPQTLGEAFGNKEKTHWSPSEIVTQLVKVPGVAGAAIALQEGLVIAHDLPEPMKGEVFAAFLPQIFARLNQYASEMRLGAVEDIRLQSSSGPCHVFRRDQVFFAAVGKVGEPLPTHTLHLCADALSDE